MNANNINEKIAYLKGLAEGLGTADSKNGKLLCGILEVLEDMAHLIRDTKNAPATEKPDSDYSDETFEVKCPFCKNRVLVQTDEILESDAISVECPECGEEIDLMADENCDDCPGCAGCSAEEGDPDGEGDLSF